MRLPVCGQFGSVFPYQAIICSCTPVSPTSPAAFTVSPMGRHATRATRNGRRRSGVTFDRHLCLVPTARAKGPTPLRAPKPQPHPQRPHGVHRRAARAALWMNVLPLDLTLDTIPSPNFLTAMRLSATRCVLLAAVVVILVSPGPAVGGDGPFGVATDLAVMEMQRRDLHRAAAYVCWGDGNL